MQVIEQLFFFAVIILGVNFIVGLFQEYAPEVLPSILRRNEEMMNTYKMTMAFKGLTGIDMHYSDVSGNSLEHAERAVLDELNKKKFISLEVGKVIPTDAIMYVQIVKKPEPFDPEKYHDLIYPKKTPM